MQAPWKSRLAKVAFWLIAEITLNSTGLDNLADYSEYVFEKGLATSGHCQVAINLCV